MDIESILSRNPSLKRLIKVAINSRKEVVKLNRLLNAAGLSMILVIFFSITFVIFISYAASQYVNTFDVATFTDSRWHKFFSGPLVNHSYKFIYAALGLAFLIQYYFRKPYQLKLQQFQRDEKACLHEIMNTLYPEHTFSDTRFANKEDQFEMNKIFGWHENQTASYKIYGTLEKKDSEIKSKLYDVEVKKYSNVPSFINMVPYVNVIYYFSLMAIQNLKNIFLKSTEYASLKDFRGLYAISEFPKSFNGHTIVLPKKIESYLQHWDVKEQEKVNLENVHFANEFLVYSTDQVEARYAISTAMMDKILAFKEKANLPIMIAFVNNTMNIAIKNRDGVFSIPTAKKEVLEVLEEITEEVNAAIDLENDFSLNRRIFG